MNLKSKNFKKNCVMFGVILLLVGSVIIVTALNTVHFDLSKMRTGGAGPWYQVVHITDDLTLQLGAHFGKDSLVGLGDFLFSSKGQAESEAGR